PVHQRPWLGPRAGRAGRGCRPQRELLRGTRSAAREIRSPLPDPGGAAGGREPLEGGADGQGGPYHVLPADGASRIAAQPAERIRGRVRHSPERGSKLDGSGSGPTPVPGPGMAGLGGGATPPPAAESDAPLAGVSSAII